MNQTGIFFPVVALAMRTLTAMLLISYHSFRTALRGHLEADDFKFGESLRVPDDVRIPNSNLIILFKVPVLVDAACLSLEAAGNADALALALAWTYILLRVLHGLIHLGYNKVVHRFPAYAASNLVIWLRLFRAPVA